MIARFLLNQMIIEDSLRQHERVLDVVRRNQQLTGTKEACGEGDCGACQILLGELLDNRLHYQAVNACLLPVGAVSGQHIVTVEGLNGPGLNPIQQALVAHGAIQCGFCTPGLVTALTGFFLNSAVSDESAALDSVAGNLCRCTGYAGIKRAIRHLCLHFDLSGSPLENRITDLIAWNILPGYFADVAPILSHCSPDDTEVLQDDALLIAGGTDLFVQKPENLQNQPLHFLNRTGDMPFIRQQRQHYVIDALATVEQLRTSPLLRQSFPNIAEDFKLICSAPVRHRATVGGNLVNASPVADLAVFLLALDAVLTIVSGGHARSVALRDFFTGYKEIDLHAGERLSDIRFEIPNSATAFNFEKVSKRPYLDIASVNTACCIRHTNGRIDKAQLSAGGVAPFPLYLAATCNYLQERSIDPETVKAAANIVQDEIAPVSDLRGSVRYKRLLMTQLFYAHFLKLFPDRITWEALNGL